MAEARRDLQFTSLELLKDCKLGAGAYGVVYKARCDELVCAGKVLSPVLFHFFDLSDLRGNAVWENFRRECQYLSVANHPNVVQYLATAREPKSGLPILLMELMDESLTHFLKRRQDLLPYRLQVNLCHDIALALAYLHSNLGIVHRDLSSNNILLVAGCRAKVADFGMSKLLRCNPSSTPNTVCPGTQPYMPPEALEDPALYTDKLDSFSHGVLSIQIVTCQFPEPTECKRRVQDEQYSVGEIYVPIDERERRRAHIDLIRPDHPLLPVTLSCLEYKPERRPSASQLCRQLAILKTISPYVDSVHCVQKHEGSTEVEDFRLTRTSSSDDVVRDGQIEACGLQCSTTAGLLRQETAVVVEEEAREKAHQKRDTMNEAVKRKDHEIETLRREAEADVAAMKQEMQRLSEAHRRATATVQEKDRLIEAGKEKVQELNQQLLESQEIVAQFQQRLDGTRVEVSRQDSGQAIACSPTTSPPGTLKWRQDRSHCPRTMARGCATGDGSTVYFTPHLSNDIFIYSSRGGKWVKLPSCPYRGFGLAVVNGLLTTIGGAEMGMAGRVTNTLLSLVKESMRWTKRLPPMLNQRQLVSAVCDLNNLVVIGGVAHGRLNVVEVMDTHSLQWSTVSSLPHPLSESSTTLVGDKLYLAGGLDGSGATTAVLCCSLTSLVRSSQSLTFRAFITGRKPVWQKASGLPFYRSTVVGVGGQLLSVGGCNWDGTPTATIHAYDDSGDVWRAIGQLSVPRRLCLVAALQGNELLVVGGKASHGAATADVEVATLEP